MKRAPEDPLPEFPPAPIEGESRVPRRWFEPVQDEEASQIASFMGDLAKHPRTFYRENDKNGKPIPRIVGTKELIKANPVQGNLAKTWQQAQDRAKELKQEEQRSKKEARKKKLVKLGVGLLALALLTAAGAGIVLVSNAPATPEGPKPVSPTPTLIVKEASSLN